MNDLLEEIYRELVPDIPENAITIKSLIEKGGGKISRSTATRLLQEKVDKEGWKTIRWKSERYYWKPDHQK